MSEKGFFNGGQRRIYMEGEIPPVFERLPYDICDSLDDQIFHVSVQQVVFPYCHCGEAVHSAHLCCGQHNASEASRCTDEDFMRFREQHPGVNDVPGSSRRR